MHMPWPQHVCRGQRAMCRSMNSPSTVWVVKTELMVSVQQVPLPTEPPHQSPILLKKTPRPQIYIKSM